jgi:glycosyltransferase involved in cell wall biosynthesis
MLKNILFSPAHYIYEGSKWGSEIYWTFNIADRICSKYPESVVVTGSIQATKKTKYKVYELQNNKNELDLGIINSLMFNFRYTLKTFELLNKYKFDILHHVLPFGIGYTFNLALLVHKNSFPMVIGPIQAPLEILDTDIGTGMSVDQKVKSNKDIFPVLLRLLKKPLNYLSMKTLSSASKVVVINHYTKNYLIRLGLNESQITVIPPGIDTQTYHCIETKQKDNKIFTLISTSKLIQRKRVDLIIKAASETIKNGYRIKLLIIGDGPQRKQLEELAKGLALGDAVEFTGYVDQKKIVILYSQADVFVSMSRDESWGQVYLEAMACGLPVLTTMNHGSKEILIDKECGYFVGNEDFLGLSQKISSLIDNRDLCVNIGKYTRKYVIETYDWDKVIIPKYLNLYKSILSTNGVK